MQTVSTSWLKSRQSGVLLHLSSLPSQYGIGNMGTEAKHFIDYLAASGFAYWQICPAGPTGYGDSPYQTFSSFGGNPYFIDIDALIEEDLLKEEETILLKNLPKDRVDYGALYSCFFPVLDLAFERFKERSDLAEEFHSFIEERAYWLLPYSTYMALKRRFYYRPWGEWPKPFRNGSDFDDSLLDARDRSEQRRQQFYQFIFFRQWDKLRSYAKEQGIQIIGDVPIYVALDSSDCWQAPEAFAIDDEGQPTHVAGVPPDYFSIDGQFWGNPLYNWKRMSRDGYSWWIARLAASFELYDAIRLDHFRGFDSYWEIPSDAADATEGRWRKGPGKALFDAIESAIPHAKFIAEDLGYINRDVFELRRQTGFPGMKIMQFGYGHDDNNVNLPHFFDANQVVYTGTHDNNSLRGWYETLDRQTRNLVNAYFKTNEKEACWSIIQAAFSSVARLCVVPAQDILNLPAASRMNTPGTADENWQWRLTHQQLETLASDYREPYLALNQLYNRIDDHAQRDFSAPPLVLVDNVQSQESPQETASQTAI
ncbi:MAG: 4-alpha-glucanotransferase [Verrucomicrobiota bacterium]